MQSAEINLLDRSVFGAGVPHGWFTHLRENAPVFFPSEPHGPGFCVVSKYADVRAVDQDTATYSSDRDRGGVSPLEGPVTPTGDSLGKVLIAMDPPEHTRHRKLVRHGFSSRVVKSLEPRIREMAVRTAGIKHLPVDLGGRA